MIQPTVPRRTCLLKPIQNNQTSFAGWEGATQADDNEGKSILTAAQKKEIMKVCSCDIRGSARVLSSRARANRSWRN